MPITRPLLADLDADALARELHPLLAARLDRLSALLQPTPSVRRLLPPERSQLAAVLHRLVAYAIAGGSPKRTGYIARADLRTLHEALRGCGGAIDGFDITGSGDPATPLELLLVAVVAQARLADSEALTVRQLAVLAGVSRTYVHRLVAAGELTHGDDGIPFATAARFLAQRRAAREASCS